MSDPRRIPGDCALCGERIREIVAAFPRDHALAGWPQRLGKLVDKKAVALALVLLSGKQATVTICGKCAEKELTAEDYRTMWRRAARASAFLLENRQWLGERDPPPAAASERSVARTLADLPLGVLARARLS